MSFHWSRIGPFPRVDSSSVFLLIISIDVYFLGFFFPVDMYDEKLVLQKIRVK